MNRKRFGTESKLITWMLDRSGFYWSIEAALRVDEESRREIGEWLLRQRSRLEIPLRNAIEADLFEQGRPHASERGILLIGLDEIAQTRYGVVPKPAQGIPQDALLVAAQIDFHFHEARTELTALDHAAGHNILRR